MNLIDSIRERISLKYRNVFEEEPIFSMMDCVICQQRSGHVKLKETDKATLYRCCYCLTLNKIRKKQPYRWQMKSRNLLVLILAILVMVPTVQAAPVMVKTAPKATKKKYIYTVESLLQKIRMEIESSKRYGSRIAVVQGVNMYRPSVIEEAVLTLKMEGYTVQTNTNKGRRLAIVVSW